MKNQNSVAPPKDHNSSTIEFKDTQRGKIDSNFKCILVKKNDPGVQRGYRQANEFPPESLEWGSESQRKKSANE